MRACTFINQIFFALVLFACATSRYTYHPPQEESAGTVIFMAFLIRADSSGKSEITFVNAVHSNVQMKAVPPQANIPYAIEIMEADKSGHLLGQQQIEHPLFKSHEFVNAQNIFTRRTTGLKEAQFFVRFNRAPAMDHIVLNEIREGKKVASTSFSIPQ